MLYISAQPDQLYFIWQLEIQLRNLFSLGILKENIQVIVGYHKENGINPLFQKFIDDNKHLAQFYTYPDLRKNSRYTSSIRPNILKQHFKKFPLLSTRTVMYHDSDILFSRIPKIDNVEKNDICYVSDTRSYLDMRYIRRTASEELLDEMLKIVGISKAKVVQEDEQTGGAQYVLKGITAPFWEKVERDSENLYVAMTAYNLKIWENTYPWNKEYRSQKRGIQAWCADMWAVLWNLWLCGKKVEIHNELIFSWPISPIEHWDVFSIQHYSGNIENKMKDFKKNEYINYFPWYDEQLNSIPDSTCSFKIVEIIKNRRQELDGMRKKYSKMEVLLYCDEQEQITNTGSKSFIQKNFDIDVGYCLHPTDNETNSDGMLFNHDRMLFIPADIVLSNDTLENIFDTIQLSDADWVYPLTDLHKVDALFTETFSKVLDISLLEMNVGKMNTTNTDKLIFTLRPSGNYDQDLERYSDIIRYRNFDNHQVLDINSLIFSLTYI
ncbi:hypothetical protein [Sphingobacterium sp. SYP-B4668]|uniref:hypothetical protein n=1 Tax=Sphingobacterium sp. SYP-B4668 TaxID=2996035 RepID=UPI0022DD0F3E|nr:hypothetical protein [Sphingobacterium sp. SYP-B4668]